MAALIGQLSYMNWASRARTLPLFMEATHAISAFAVSATLIRAVFKPFGQPFKVTDKGGDRSKPRVHWRLAAMFGMIGFSSLASIVWAFISPYAAAEISSLDFFNLLWAAVAILIALIAFVACFERRRDEEIFAVGEDTYVIANNSRLSCALVSLSTSVANITVGQDDLSRLTRHLTLLIPGIGLVTGSLTKVTATSARVHIQPSPAQRAQLLLTLYPSPNTSVASRARMTATAIGLWRRGFSR
jgi:cellulose synthase (UDP-forming)